MPKKVRKLLTVEQVVADWNKDPKRAKALKDVEKRQKQVGRRRQAR